MSKAGRVREQLNLDAPVVLSAEDYVGIEELSEGWEDKTPSSGASTQVLGALDGLIGIAAATEAFAESPMTEDQRNVLNVATAALLYPLDIAPQEVGIEEFNLGELEAGVESFGEGLMKWIKSIIEAIKRAVESLMEYLGNFFTTVPGVKQRAEKLLAAVRSLKKGTSDEKVTYSGAKAVSLEGKSDKATLIKVAGNLTMASKLIYEWYPKKVAEFYTVLADLKLSRHGAGFAIEPNGNFMQRLADAEEKLVDVSFNGEIAGGVHIQPGVSMFGAGKGFDPIKGTKAPSLVRKPVKMEHDRVEEEVLDKDSMQTILQHVIGTCNLIANRKESIKVMEKDVANFASKLVGQIDMLLRKGSYGLQGLDPAGAALQRAIFRLGAAPWFQIVRNFSGFCFGTMSKLVKMTAQSYAVLSGDQHMGVYKAPLGLTHAAA